MTNIFYRIIIGTILILGSCKENTHVGPPVSLELEKIMNIDNYFFYQGNRKSYDRIKEIYLTDTLKFKPQFDISIRLAEINTIVDDVCRKYRGQLLSTLKGQMSEIIGDTLNLKDIDYKDKTITKEYADKFKNDIKKIVALQKEVDALMPTETFGVYNQVETVWTKNEYNAEEFISHLTITRNLLLKHISCVYDNLLDSFINK